MPLFIIAIVFLIGLLIYVITGYAAGISERPSIDIDFIKKFKRNYPDVNFEVEDEEEEENDETQGF